MIQGTKYYLMKRCQNCFMINEFQLTKCGQCDYLFTEQMSETEKDELNSKWMKLQEKSKNIHLQNKEE